MSVIITRSPWTRQPQVAVPVNKSNPLSNGLVKSTSEIWLSSGTVYRPATSKGIGFAGNGSDSYYYQIDSAGGLSLANPWTIFAVFVGASGATDVRGFGLGNSADGFPILHLGSGISDAAKGRVWIRGTGGASSDADTAATVFEAGVPHAFCLSSGGGTDTIRSYVDGVADATVAAGTNQTATFDRVAVGCLLRSTPSSYNASTVLIGYIWKRQLSPSEIAAVSANPWQLFAPLPRRIWVPSAGGGNATATLTGAATTSSAGTLSATGGAAVTLTGASTASSVGAVSASAATNASTTLTGAATTASAGTLAATGGAAVTLTGASTTASAGTVNATAGGNATVTLPSASTTSSAGTLSATGGASKTLGGANTTASAGAVLASAGTNASVTLTGASTSAAVGALSASGAAQIVLTGVQVTASAGTVTATGVRNASVTLTSTAATAYAGAVSAYAGILNVFTRPPKSATLHGKSRQVAVLLSRPDRDIGNILKD